MSLRPGSELLDAQPLPPERLLSKSVVQASPRPLEPVAQLATEDGQTPCSRPEEKAPKWATEQKLEKSWLTNGFDVFECPPPKTENEVGGERGPRMGECGGLGGKEDRRVARWTDCLAWTLTGVANLVTSWALSSSHIPAKMMDVHTVVGTVCEMPKL